MTNRAFAFRDRIFTHRGIWNSHAKQNSLESFELAAKAGFSIETDLRLQNQEIIISHDPPMDSDNFLFKAQQNSNSRFALNIKEDNVINYFDNFGKWFESTRSFFFDGSIPEMYKIRNKNFSHALRLSEYEKVLPWIPDVVWLDSFHSDWWIHDQEINKLIETRETVVVSPEIHGRNSSEVWDYIYRSWQSGNPYLRICTDLPFEFLQQGSLDD
jgi:hypothetical protein